MEVKRILVVSNSIPYPAYFGGAFDVFERIKGLKQLGYSIDLICTYKTYPSQETIEYLKTIVDELILVTRKNNFWDILNNKPLQVVSRKKLKDIVLKKKYFHTILESEHVGLILKNQSFKSKYIYLRVHNNESVYFNELAKSTKNIFSKFYYLSDSFKFKFYSKSFFSNVNRLWYISNEEAKSQIEFKNKSIHLPSPINDPFITQSLSNKTVLFVGSLFMKNNIEALEWYLKNVHLKLLNEVGYKLIIVGGTGDIKEEVFENKFKNISNVEYYFNVKNLQNYYDETTIFINPMLHGAGVKLKTINAIVNGLLLVSTSIGAEGIGLIDKEMYFNADSPNTFYESIIAIFNLSVERKADIIKKAQKLLMDNNYLEILIKELENDNR
jgi:hypothetical protein